MPPDTTILTLRLDAASQALFEQLRVRHYPAHLNRIGAHLTLFHSLPQAAWVQGVLEREAGATPQFPLRVTGMRSLGKGVAYTLAAGPLLQVHARLAAEFAAELTAQDRQRFAPHVVIQNKVTPVEAKTLLARLERGFAAFDAHALGLDWWLYLDGPWQLQQSFNFAAASPFPALTRPIE